MPVSKDRDRFNIGSVEFPAPWWSAPGAALYLGDVREQLRRLPARSVQCCVTSPPYWGLRDYGTGQWEGGSAECDHIQMECGMSERNTLGHDGYLPPTNAANVGRQLQYKSTCGKCGARRTDMQIGAELSPDCGTQGSAQCGACFVCSMVGVFREVHRVLRDDGVLFLNLGDTYTSGGGRTNNDRSSLGRRNTDLPRGNLIGIPWRTALALQADGWVIRSDVPWVKRSAMPESVTNRPAKSLEYVFLLAKGEGYYFDMDAVRPAALDTGGGACFGRVSDSDGATSAGAQRPRDYDRPEYSDRAFRNGDLWFQSVEGPHGVVGVGDEMVGLDVTARGYRGAHFAVFPPDLVRPLILAGTSECGCCARCGSPLTRAIASEEVGRRKPEGGAYASLPELTGTDHQNIGANSLRDGLRTARRTTAGWQRTCGCRTDDVVPCAVLDPFVGSGTTVAEALRLGRAGVGIDLSEAYLRDHAIPRVEAALTGCAVRKPATIVAPGYPPAPRRLRCAED